MTSQAALKEWAVLVDALAQGRQLILLRKGGLADPQEGFRLKHREFLLYPTWEHQRAECVRPEFRERFRELAQPPAQPHGEILLQVYAGVAYQKEIKDPAVLASLEKFHIWSPEFLRQRAGYKPEWPSQALVVRAYRLPHPVRHAIRPEYAGCTSWIDLAEPVALEGAQPVLDNQRFRAALEEISSKL